MDEVTWGPADELEASEQPDDDEADLGDALPPGDGPVPN
jgi:hypothetical protein